jgi:hypothetical protein
MELRYLIIPLDIAKGRDEHSGTLARRSDHGFRALVFGSHFDPGLIEVFLSVIYDQRLNMTLFYMAANESSANVF